MSAPECALQMIREVKGKTQVISCVCVCARVGWDSPSYPCDRLMMGLAAFVEEKEHRESSGGLAVHSLAVVSDIYSLLG